MLLLKNFCYKKCYVSIFKFANILFNVIFFFSINKDYRECLGFMCMLFNVIVFLVWMESNRYFGVWVKILKFVGMLFIYLKITSEKVRQKPLLYTSIFVFTPSYVILSFNLFTWANKCGEGSWQFQHHVVVKRSTRIIRTPTLVTQKSYSMLNFHFNYYL